MKTATINKVLDLATSLEADNLANLDNLVNQHITDEVERSQVHKMMDRVDDFIMDEDLDVDVDEWVSMLRDQMEDDEDE